MQTEQDVTEILDEAIRALTVLDLNRLEELETRISLMANAGMLRSSASPADIGKVSEKKRLLGMLLEHCRSNLDALQRLHAKNMEGQWAH